MDVDLLEIYDKEKDVDREIGVHDDEIITLSGSRRAGCGCCWENFQTKEVSIAELYDMIEYPDKYYEKSWNKKYDCILGANRSLREEIKKLQDKNFLLEGTIRTLKTAIQIVKED